MDFKKGIKWYLKITKKNETEDEMERLFIVMLLIRR